MDFENYTDEQLSDQYDMLRDYRGAIPMDDVEYTEDYNDCSDLMAMIYAETIRRRIADKRPGIIDIYRGLKDL